MPRAVRTQRQIDRYIDQKVAATAYRASREVQEVEATVPPDYADAIAEYDARLDALEAETP